MVRDIQFRVLLPIAQTAMAVLFGGLGLWQRHEILDQPWLGGGPLWNTTAAYHVWPWPFKFAVISNMPAFLAALPVLGPIERSWPGIPEWLELGPTLAFVPLLWYGVGSWMDRRWSAANGVGASRESNTP